MQLTDLPPELIAKLPDYLHSPDDWYVLIRTARCFYNICAETKATFPPNFAKHNSMAPHPQVILAGSARQIADWAMGGKENRQRLCDTISQGNEGMLKLAIEVARWNVSDVRISYRNKLEVVQLVCEILEKDGGQGLYSDVTNPPQALDTMANLQLPHLLRTFPPFRRSASCPRTTAYSKFDGRHSCSVDYALRAGAADNLELHPGGIWAIKLPDIYTLIRLSKRYKRSAYYRIGIELTGEGGHYPKHSGFSKLMETQGLHSLRMMLPDIPSSTADLVVRLRKDCDDIGPTTRQHIWGHFEEKDWRGLTDDCVEYRRFGLDCQYCCTREIDVASSTLGCQHLSVPVNYVA